MKNMNTTNTNTPDLLTQLLQADHAQFKHLLALLSGDSAADCLEVLAKVAAHHATKHSIAALQDDTPEAEQRAARSTRLALRLDERLHRHQKVALEQKRIQREHAEATARAGILAKLPRPSDMVTEILNEIEAGKPAPSGLAVCAPKKSQLTNAEEDSILAMLQNLPGTTPTAPIHLQKAM